jgi:hypothetical protein
MKEDAIIILENTLPMVGGYWEIRVYIKRGSGSG